jgi:Transposase DDE domain
VVASLSIRIWRSKPLMLGMVFGLRLRQSEGFLNSVLEFMALALPVPDHTTLSRRASTWKPSARSNDRQHVADGPIHVLVDSTGLKVYGGGQWLEEKHGVKSRRGWRKLHLAVDADSGEIIAHSLTDQEAGDASQLDPLLDQIDDEISQFTADGAYDGTPTYDAVLRHSAGAGVFIPPRSNAVEQPNAQACCQRDDHIASIQIDGRLKWQASTGYGKRALVETAMGRYKGVIGQRLRARSFLAQQTEAVMGVAILNRMLACGRPKSVRCQASTGATK